MMSTRPALVDASDVFTNEELDDLLVCWNEDKPRGRFLKDRHGYTHFQIVPGGQKEKEHDASKGLIVVCHGLGVSYYAFDKFAQYLTNAGYSVLQYDYYGHGYSKYDGDMFIEYDKEMFVDQLEDLLTFVEKETQETCLAMVGHSTGGIVCAAANDRWSKNDDCGTTGSAGFSQRSIVPKSILASPAFFAKKVRSFFCFFLFLPCCVVLTIARYQVQYIAIDYIFHHSR
jgi:Lysophospholipase